MQHGCMERLNRKRGPEAWQFRWSVTSPDGKRLYHKKIVGTVEQYPDENAARRSRGAGLGNQHRWQSNEFRPDDCRTTLRSFRATRTREGKHLAQSRYEESLQSVLEPLDSPQWQKHELAEVGTIQVESWLRGLPLAKSSCAKIRNLMSVLFNHACQYELFDRNPIYLVRQSAKRRKPPTVLAPSEIKTLVDHLDMRERTLVLLAASTGLRQSEMSTDGTVSHWKYIIGNVIVYRHVYRADLRES